MDRIKPIKPTFTRHQRDRTAGLILTAVALAAMAWYHFNHQIRPLREKEMLALVETAKAYYDSLDAAAGFDGQQFPKTIILRPENSKPEHGKEYMGNKDENNRDPDALAGSHSDTSLTSSTDKITHSSGIKSVAHPPSTFTGASVNKITPRKILPVDINRSEALDWESLPGIGPYYASKIIEFRERLGGFYSKDQVQETWQLPDSTFRKILPYLQESPIMRFIDLNEVDIPTLANHPYLTWKDAKLIVRYRQQHGRYLFIEDLLNIHAFDSSYLNRVMPYFQVKQTAPPITSGAGS